MSPICKSVLNEKLLVDTCMYEIHVCVEMYKYKCKFAYSFGCGSWEFKSFSTQQDILSSFCRKSKKNSINIDFP